MSGVRQEHLYLCVQEMHKEGYAVTEICDILELNRSSYYNWTHRTKSSREMENEALLHEIGVIYAEHKIFNREIIMFENIRVLIFTKIRLFARDRRKFCVIDVI